RSARVGRRRPWPRVLRGVSSCVRRKSHARPRSVRSEEHTSELQSHLNLVCRLLLEKKKHEVRDALSIAGADEGVRVLGGDLPHLPEEFPRAVRPHLEAVREVPDAVVALSEYGFFVQ